MELDFEKTMSLIQGLENSLDPVLHSVALLTREKEKEEAKLEEDYRLLRRLKGNLRDERGVWGERGRREHLLVPGGRVDGEGDKFGRVDGLEIVKREVEGVEGVFKVGSFFFSFYCLMRWFANVLGKNRTFRKMMKS